MVSASYYNNNNNNASVYNILRSSKFQHCSISFKHKHLYRYQL